MFESHMIYVMQSIYIIQLLHFLSNSNDNNNKWSHYYNVDKYNAFTLWFDWCRFSRASEC